MTKKNTVSVAFRSKETGRYLFWVKWAKDEWDRIEKAAALDNKSVEDFIIEAIKMFIRKNEEALSDR